MRRPQGIIFDYGNTILNEDYFDLLAGTRRILEFAEGEVRLTATEIQVEWQRLNDEINRLRNSVNLEFTNRNFQTNLYTSLGLTINLSPEQMEREFWRAAQRFSPADGIQSVMSWLQIQGIKTGIISNCPFSASVMQEVLTKYDLDRYFGFFISSADHGFRKPHPRIFQTALCKIGLAAQDVWFVGDNIDCDIRGAHISGLFPVWYNHLNLKNPRGYAGLEVKSWAEFLDILKLQHS